MKTNRVACVIAFAAALACVAAESPPRPPPTLAALPAATPTTHTGAMRVRVEQVLARDAAHLNEDERAHLATLILDEAVRCDIDPMLVLALIGIESDFRSEAVSPQGAVGFLQLQPPTAEWIARQLTAEPSMGPNLRDAATNLRLGVRYFVYLVGRFGHVTLGLEAYNRGPNAPALFERFVARDFANDSFSRRVLARYRDYLRLAECPETTCALDGPWSIAIAPHDLVALSVDAEILGGDTL
jgi:soluble lytic murein transglycosylase